MSHYPRKLMRVRVALLTLASVLAASLSEKCDDYDLHKLVGHSCTEWMQRYTCHPANGIAGALSAAYCHLSCGTCINSTRHTAEVAVLGALYNSTGGERWSLTWPVSGGSHHCWWHGVACNVNGSTIAILLKSSNLHGKLPSALGSLRHLRYL